MSRIVIVGAGIGGLALAEALTRRAGPGVQVVVLERGARAGGNIRTERVDGYLCEHGPNGFLDNAPATLDLVGRLRLSARLQPSNDRARRRFVFRRGSLHRVPDGPAAFLTTHLLSIPGKLRLLAEPFVGAADRSLNGDESVHAFASRRIGGEAARVLVGSMVRGIFGGDARQLSMRAAFPKLWELERRHGGLVRGALALRLAKWRLKRAAAPCQAGRATTGPGLPAGRLVSFTDGMGALVDALALPLAGDLRTGCVVRRIHEVRGGRRPYAVAMEGDAPLDADAVVLAGPASAAASMVQGLDPILAEELAGIPTAPLAVLCLGFDAGALASAGVRVDGFGFLVAPEEGLRLLGAVWESTVYAGRAPAGRVLVRVMLGGVPDPNVTEGSDDALLAMARDDLQAAMGLGVPPSFVRIVRHRVGIPQYVCGHVDRLRRIEDRLERHAGLFLAGSSYRGTSLNACIADADPLAARVLASLAVRAAV